MIASNRHSALLLVSRYHNCDGILFNSGVDFTVKSVRIGDRVVALQLWDTAGQERFRSITKQYFRKADGVVIMYDVTSEQSFLNVRNWMQSVKDGVEEHCVLSIVANKIDLCENEDTRAVTFKDGAQLAEVGAHAQALSYSRTMNACTLKLVHRMARALLNA